LTTETEKEKEKKMFDTVGKRIAFGFLAVLAIMAVVGGVGYYGLSNTASISNTAAECSQMIELSLQCRRNEKDFMLRGDVKYQEKLHGQITKIKELVDSTRSSVDASGSEQLDTVLTSADAYKAAFDQYVSLAAQQKGQAKIMVDNARAFIATNEALRDAFKKNLAEGQVAAKATVDGRLWKVFAAKDVGSLILECRRSEKDYVVRGDLKYIKKLDGYVATMKETLAELRSKHSKQSDWDYVDAISKGVGAYEKVVKAYVEAKEAKNEGQAAIHYPDLSKAAKTVVEPCNVYIAAQQAKLTSDRTKADAKVADGIWKAGQTEHLIELALMCRRHEKDFILRHDEKYLGNMNDRIKEIETAIKAVEARTEDQKTKTSLQGALVKAQAYKTAFDQWVALWNKQEETKKQMGDNVHEFMTQCATLVQVQDERKASVVALSTVLTISVVAGGIALGLALAFFITRGITKPINRIVEGLTSGAEQTSSASGQVSSASQSLAQGASEQAAAVEEVTSSIEEMASMTKQNAANADEAKSLAANATAGTDKGTEAMGRMSTAIEDIKKSSDETAKIIKTIDEIAFQTNLLALNAAVEAARAGEAGKGFAVVAEEVRNLAQRSAEAAKDTAEMIEGSVKNADNGVTISTEVATLLNEIAENNGKVNDLVGEIAAASNEQAQGIEQINTAVGQMDQVTQSNAANAEESASASEELSAQAEALSGMVVELQSMVKGSKGATGKKPEFQADHSAVATHQPVHHIPEAQPSTTVRTRTTATAAAGANEEEFPMDDDQDLASF